MGSFHTHIMRKQMGRKFTANTKAIQAIQAIKAIQAANTKI